MKPLSLRFLTPWWMALLALLVLAGCGSDDNPISPTASATNQVSTINSTVPDNVFSATLTGNQAVPPVNTLATGSGIVVVDLNTRQMKATVITADVNATEAHIHQAPTGVNGPVVFPLTQSNANSGIWSTSVTLTPEQLTTLRASNLYFNVHSAAFPDGEIRGQILAQLPASGKAITSSSETQTGTGTTGTTSTNTGTTTTTGIAAQSTSGTSSGGMDASSGSSGNGTTTSTTASSGTGTGSGTQAGATSQAQGAQNQSAQSQGATTQGSAVAAANRPVFFTNLLSGSLVVPANSSTASATGLSVYRPQEQTLTSVVVATGITGTGANIRQAAAGAIGPVVTSMIETGAGSGIWTSRARLTDVQVQALNAGTLYYEVVSAAFPNGELRGQIVKTLGASKAAGTGAAAGSVVPQGASPTTGATTPTTGTTGTITGTEPTPSTATGTTTPTTGTTGATTGTEPTPGTATGTTTPTTGTTGATTGTEPTPSTATGTTTPTTGTTGTTTGTEPTPGTATGTTTPTNGTTGTTTGTSTDTVPTTSTGTGTEIPVTTTTSTTTVTPITTVTGTGAIPVVTP